jgi:hypothetical protein
MWGFRMMQGSPEGLLMMVMWLAYLVNACYGFYNWSKGSAKKPESAKNHEEDSRRGEVQEVVISS